MSDYPIGYHEEFYKHPQRRMKGNKGAHKHCEETNYHQPDILLLD